MKVIPSLSMGESMQIVLAIHHYMYAPQLTSLEILLLIFPMHGEFCKDVRLLPLVQRTTQAVDKSYTRCLANVLR